jgi:hypothetical protein
MLFFCMARHKVQVLFGIRWFLINVSYYVPSLFDYQNIEEWNLGFTVFKCELDIITKCVKYIMEIIYIPFMFFNRFCQF